MADFRSLSAPPAFLPTSGAPELPWEQWRKAFEVYLLASGADDLPDKRKRALLLHCLGCEGQNVFSNLKDAGDTYKAAMVALEAHFAPKVNVVSERYKFRQRCQLPHETTEEYANVLRGLASRCKFGTLMEEMVRDQIIEKTKMPRLRERLLIESDLTLEKTLVLAAQSEAATLQAREMEASAQVSAVSKSKPGKVTSQVAKCYRCGSTKHLAACAGCPGMKAKCSKCGKSGHFTKCCMSKTELSGSTNPSGTATKAEVSGRSNFPRKKVCNVDIMTIDDGDVGSQLMHKVLLTADGVSTECEMLIDTGSQVSLIPDMLYKDRFSAVPLSIAPHKLVSVMGQPLPVQGCVILQVTVPDTNKSTKAVFYVVEEVKPILGLNVMSALALTLSPGTPHPVSAVKVEEEDHLSMISGFIHKPNVNPQVQSTRAKARRLPFSIREEVDQELNRMLKADIIEEAEAPEWLSPLVVTRRRNGQVRICVDLRGPNKAIIQDAFPLPHLEEMFHRLRGAEVYSTLDLTKAYHQLELHPDVRNMTAFATHDAVYRFKRCPLGMSSVPGAFQRVMATVLKGVQGVQSYLDDLIVFGATVQEHDQALATVLQKLKACNIQLNMEKCKLRQSSVSYLGLLVSKEGLKVDPDRIRSVAEAVAPTSREELQSFLGLAGYYAKFVPDFATVVEPLRQLLRGCQAFQWSDDANRAFEEVKQRIVQSGPLTPFDPNLPTLVTTDASGVGLGATLSQLHGTQERIVAFASRSLTTAERNYAATEREGLACVWAVEKWRTYLWGHHFTLRTDHQALQTLLSPQAHGRAGMRIARWAARLMVYHFDVKYIKGCDNIITDCLSRLHHSELPDGQSEEDDFVVAAVGLPAITEACFREECGRDKVLAALRELLHTDWPRRNQLPANLRPYHAVRHELCVADDLLYRGERLIAPQLLQDKIVSLAHEQHQGMVRSKQLIRQTYWWPGLDAQVEEAVRRCQVCQKNEKTMKCTPTPLQPVEFPPGPWFKVGVDIVGPLTGPKQCRYAIVAMDYYSKWPEVGFTEDITSSGVIRFLNSVFAREGYVHELVTDNGTQFVSQEFEDYLRVKGIRHLRSSNYHPQANGEVERFNQVLKNTLRSAKLADRPWKEAVTEFLLHYRATPHAATRASPSQLLHGRLMTTKLTVLPEKPRKEEDLKVRERVQKAQKKMKAYTDARRRGRPARHAVGDWVRARRAGDWHGPLQVMKQRGRWTFLLSDGKVWNASRLSHTAEPLDTRAPLPEASEQTTEETLPEQRSAEPRSDAHESPQRASSSGDATRRDGAVPPGRQLRSAAERRPSTRYRDYVCD